MVRSTFGAGLAAVILAVSFAHAQDQTPRFRSSVQVTLLDVTVVDGDGHPITDLRPGDFSVSIDGHARPVVSAEWIPLAERAREAGPSPVPTPAGYTSNQAPSSGRLIALLVDQGHISFGGTVGMRSAVNGFIDRLEPSDRVALLGLCPGGPPPIPFTTDREIVKHTLASMVGQWTVFHMESPVSPGSSGGAFSQTGPDLSANIPLSPCGGADAGGALDASGAGQGPNLDEDATWENVRTLMRAMQDVEGSKTIVLVSEGLARPSETSIAAEIERQAAAAHTTVYGLLLDRRVPDALSRSTNVAFQAGDFDSRDGLSSFVNATGGAVFTAAVSADAAVARIEAEISGYYVVGVESEPADHGGDDRRMSVRVARPAATVRARRWLSTRTEGAGGSPEERIQAAFGSFLPLSGLPIRVGTFTMRQPNRAEAYVLTHAELGSDYTAPTSVTLGLTVTAQDGRLLATRSGTSQLVPERRDRPSPLDLTTSLSLPPGDYLMKIAVVEGERTGSVERPLHVGFPRIGVAELSGLIAGGAAGPAPGARPAVGSTVASGYVQGYLEAYGLGVESLRAVFTVRPADAAGVAGGDPVAGPIEIPRQDVEARKAVFSGVLDVHALRPGQYVLQAAVTLGSQTSSSRKGSRSRRTR